MKKLAPILPFLLLCAAWNSHAQSPGATAKHPLSEEVQTVFNQLRAQDSLLFQLGYNQSDTAQLRLVIHDDFEFYHDQSGLLESKELFLKGISGLCHMNYKATRVLDLPSLEVHLLKNNGNLYGAIQTGKHAFYGEEPGKPRYLTSTATFTHVWILENGSWKLKRVLSYDHVVPGEER